MSRQGVCIVLLRVNLSSPYFIANELFLLFPVNQYRFLTLCQLYRTIPFRTKLLSTPLKVCKLEKEKFNHDQIQNLIHQILEMQQFFPSLQSWE